MLVEANCIMRNCKHFGGIKNDEEPGNPEKNERYYCDAFPDRIPSEIVQGRNLHNKPLKGQGNDIVFEGGLKELKDAPAKRKAKIKNLKAF